jgi:hypothetical protein
MKRALDDEMVKRFLLAWSYTLGMFLLTTVLVLGTGMGSRKLAVLALAYVALLLIPLMHHISANWGLVCVSTLSIVVGSLFLYLVLPVRSAMLDSIFNPIPHKPIGIYQPDERFGYHHKPASIRRHETNEYSVVYTIGEDQCRITPTPERARGRILVLGGSFAFGLGVDDDEVFSALLARDLWSDFKVSNCAVSGWGTSHAYIALADALASEDPPVLTIYAMIPHHVRRNYIRENWLSHLRLHHKPQDSGDSGTSSELNRGYHPHYQLVDGHLEFQGLVAPGAGLPVTPELLEKEVRLTIAFLQEMNKAARTRGVAFAVVILEGGRAGRELEPAIVDALHSDGIPFLDLSHMILERFGNDSHPNRSDHQRIANAIAASFIAGLIPEEGY